MKPIIVALLSATFILCCQPCFAQLSPQQQKDLTAFTRLYGYTRFFHPSDEAADLDWKGFAIYGAGIVLTAKDDRELIAILRELFHPIAPTVVIYPEGEKDKFSSAAITPPDTNNYKTVAWQHYGIRLSSNSVYQSVRINRPMPEQLVMQAFAPIIQSFPADRLRGKEFRLSGWMKVDSSWGGAGHFWMRIEEKGKVVFFYNMDNRPATSNSWKEYSFTGQADKDADTVVMGAFLTGKGSLLVDHMQLSVKEGEEWKDVPLENSSFEKDSNSVPKGWHYNQKLAGYRFAVETADVHEGSKALSIVSIKDTSQVNKPMARPLYDQYPQPGEFVQSSLAPGIACIVPLALYGTKEHTFPEADTLALTHLERAIHAATPATVSGDSLAVRLGDIVISWNIFRHFFAYWEDASATPDQVLDKALAKASKDRTRYDFLQTLKLMTNPLNDGHIFVSMYNDSSRTAVAPLVFAKAEGRLVIDQVQDSALKTTVAAGDVVTKVNGQPADQYMQAIDRTFSGSPQFRLSRTLYEITTGPANSLLTLTLQRQDGNHVVTVSRIAWNSAPAASSATKHSSGWIKPGIFYIDLDRDPMDSIRAWIPQLTTAKAIICDLRGYPKANHELLCYLLKEKDTTKWMFIPEVNYPDYQRVSYMGAGWALNPKTPHLDGKVFFLTGGSAISYAESYMGYVKDFHLATVIGQPTAGTNGNINPFDLPGGYHISWTGMLVKDHEGGKHHLKGIVPDVLVERTIKGIREGRDEYLEKALELASQ